eukprot:5875747-Amphidinium_carterae.1
MCQAAVSALRCFGVWRTLQSIGWRLTFRLQNVLSCPKTIVAAEVRDCKCKIRRRRLLLHSQRFCFESNCTRPDEMTAVSSRHASQSFENKKNLGVLRRPACRGGNALALGGLHAEEAGQLTGLLSWS